MLANRSWWLTTADTKIMVLRCPLCARALKEPLPSDFQPDIVDARHDESMEAILVMAEFASSLAKK